MIDKELLDILACPACKADVRLEGDRIVCIKCGRRYPIKDDIPIMLIDEAQGGPAEEKTEG
ncbi:MAG: Trm112 family protein [Candidatus Omnitrophica bacterium]|nr:Trm112 family protein [Candidatus Omnitrophota bacterium]MBI5144041.1 Trm112 family protein [Candidatus Omnitrophota bacterium]